MTRFTLHGHTRFVAACACAMFLGGCVHATQPVQVHHYDLGTSTTATSGSENRTGRTGKVLRVARISVPQWLVGTGMHYRLDYRNDRQLAVYAHSDWAAPPAALLETVIQDVLATHGDWRAVVGPGSPATADASLHIRLDDFSQAFSQPHDSAGVIDATATLIGDHGDKVLAQRHFHVEIATETPDAQGGVAALAEASRHLATLLQRWLQQTGARAD